MTDVNIQGESSKEKLIQGRATDGIKYTKFTFRSCRHAPPARVPVALAFLRILRVCQAGCHGRENAYDVIKFHLMMPFCEVRGLFNPSMLKRNILPPYCYIDH